MPALRVTEIATAAGGTLLRGDGERRVTSFAIDTRQLDTGGAFFALRGSRTDGHAFVHEAARKGAEAAIVERALEEGAAAPPAVIRVEDGRAALWRVAESAREKLGCRFVAITGSVGKTTTKEMIAAGLASRRRVHRTAGNLNNRLGVPLSLLACPEDAEWAVLELGMSEPGEIADLGRLVDPDVVLVTNVRPAHLANFRDLDDIAAAKGELFAVLRDDATAVVNLDDPNVRVQAARHPGPRKTYGKSPAADVVVEAIEDRFDAGTRLVFRHAERSREIHLRTVGAHAAWNAVAALATVLAAGEDLDAAAEAVAAVEAAPGRGRVVRLPDCVTVVDDTYNSNPAALASVLETLRRSTAERKVLVVGDMLELGPREVDFHREAGRKAAAAGVRILVGVGPLSRHLLEAARRAGVAELYHEPDSSGAAERIVELVRPGDLVVCKGSRGIRLERVVEALVTSRTEVRG